MVIVLTASRCLAHAAPTGFPERPERLASVLTGLRAAGHEIREVESRGDSSSPDDLSAEDTLAAIKAVHDGDYVERFRRAVERGDGLLDSADNPLSSATWDAALGAVEAALEGARFIAAAPGRSAFVAVRPPGHHAERDRAMGFCYFNNVAVAAHALIERQGMPRVAIVDFDVHHGNGTQHLFEERGDVLFISLHQFPFYPGTGAADEVGKGAGRGATLNLPLAAGCGDEIYRRAFEEKVLPAIRAFEPAALLISAGFDAWRGDPLGGMTVSVEGYREWGRMLAECASETCDGRLLSLLEGGYDLESLPRLAAAYLEGIAEAARQSV